MDNDTQNAPDNPNSISSIQLIGLQEQLNGVRGELVNVSNGLEGIANLIRTDYIQDRQRLLQEEQQQRILLIKQASEGQEDALEQKVSAELVKPISKLENKTSSIFDNIENSLTTLFVGGLGIAFVANFKNISDTIKKSTSSVKKVFKDISNSIQNTLNTIKGGFGNVTTNVQGVIEKISKGINSLLKSPVKVVSDFFKKLLGIKDDEEDEKNPAPSASSISQIGSNIMSKFNDFFNSAKDYAQNFGLQSNLNVPSLTNLTQFNISSILGIPSKEKTELAANLSSEPSNISAVSNNENQNTNQSLNSNQFYNQSTLQQNLASNENKMDSTSVFISGNTSPFSPGSGGVVNLQINPLQGEKNQSTTINPSPSNSINLNPPSDVKPNVVYLTNNNQQQAPTISDQNKVLTDVPLLSSANPDNFYTLYAQLNYNVAT